MAKPKTRKNHSTGSNASMKPKYDDLFIKVHNSDKIKDYESGHSAEDEILKQFVMDVASNNFKNSKAMITMANKIKKEIIEGKPDATRWYS